MFRTLLSSFNLLFLFCFSAPAIAQIPGFTSDIVEGCAPLVVKFTDQSTGSPSSWKWDMGNGSVLYTQNPSTTFINPGTYTVKLTVNSGPGEKSIEKTGYIKVYPTPITAFSSSATNGCFPLPVKFTDLSTPESGTLTKWEWDFGDGSPFSNEKDPEHVYNTIGNYHVVLRVTNSHGCEKTLAKLNYIKISTGAKADFELDAPDNCNPPTTVNFTDKSTGTGALTYTWNFGDGGTSDQKNPSYQYSTPGSYSVALTITNDVGCKNQIIKTNAITIGTVKAAFTAPAKICAGQQIPISNTSLPQPTSAKWNFGNGDVQYAIQPYYAYPSPGNYTITLESNFGTCTDIVTKTIEVLGSPTVDFTADKTLACEAPATIRFTAQTSETLTYKWDFGDGTTSTQKDPIHTYNTADYFTVSLVATNSTGCSETITKTNYIVVDKLKARYYSNHFEGCAPLEITPSAYISPPETIATYKWLFGDGGISTDPQPVYTYTTPGEYDVKLVYTTGSGCTDTLSGLPARVGAKPEVNFSASPVFTCAFAPVSFQDATTGSPTSWWWQFGDGTVSDNQHPDHRYFDTGYFKVILIATKFGCSDTLEIDSMLHIKGPIANFTDSQSCSSPFIRWFKDRSIDADEWFWDFGDGQTSTDINPVHTYASKGSYTVTLIVKNDTCENMMRQQINIITGKAAFNISKTAVCTNEEVQFNADTDITNASNYYWDFGEGYLSSGSENPSFSYAKPGEYDVTLIIQTGNNCRDTLTKPVAIKVGGPIAGFTVPSGTVCTNTPVIFADTSKGDPVPIISWKWDYGDGTTETLSAGPFQHSYAQAGSYTVILNVTDNSGCTGQAIQYSSFQIAKPTSQFESPDLVSCTEKPIRFSNHSSGNVQDYQWFFGDGQSSTESTPEIKYSTEGLFDIKLIATDIFGCTDTLVKPAYIKIGNPRALFDVSDSIATCPPLLIDFTNRSENFISYQWDFGDNTRPAPNENPSHFYALPGNYTATLKITSPGGCIDSMQQKLVVQGPQGDFTYDMVSGCKPVTVRFYGTTTTNASFIWDYNDGAVEPGDAQISHSYTEMGEYLPRMILIDPEGCRVPIPGLYTIKVLGAEADFAPDVQVLCDSGIVNFTDLSVSNEPITGYKWIFNPGVESSLPNPSRYYNTKGSYPATLIVTTQSGCLDTLISAVPVMVADKPVINFDGDSIVCMPATILFKGVVIKNDTSTLKWQWDFGNGATAASQFPVSAIYRDQREYEAQLIVTASTGCKDTATKTIRPLPLPEVNAGEDKSIAVGSSATITATHSQDVISIVWKPSAGLSCTGCKVPEASPKKTTTYTVEVENAQGCKSLDEMTVFVFCDAGNLFMPNTFSPNGDGVNDVFYPRGKGLFTVKTLRIFNRWGELVFEKSDFNPNDISKGWTGMHNNRPSPQDVYVFSIDLICENKVILNYKGNVALIR